MGPKSLQGGGHPSQEGHHPERVEQPAERHRGCQDTEEQTAPLTAPERKETSKFEEGRRPGL